MVLTLLILSCPQVYWSKDALKNPMPWSSQPCPVITVLMTVISNFIVFLTECFEDRDIPCLSPYCQCLHTPDTWQALSYTHMHAQLCPALCDPINCSPPGSSVHGIAQARILEWVTISCFRGIFLTQGSNPCLAALAGGFFTTETSGKTGIQSMLIKWILNKPPLYKWGSEIVKVLL